LTPLSNDVTPVHIDEISIWAPASAATLRRVVALLAAHEPDLKDLLLELCQPACCPALD